MIRASSSWTSCSTASRYRARLSTEKPASSENPAERIASQSSISRRSLLVLEGADPEDSADRRLLVAGLVPGRLPSGRQQALLGVEVDRRRGRRREPDEIAHAVGVGVGRHRHRLSHPRASSVKYHFTFCAVAEPADPQAAQASADPGRNVIGAITSIDSADHAPLSSTPVKGKPSRTCMEGSGGGQHGGCRRERGVARAGSRSPSRGAEAPPPAAGISRLGVGVAHGPGRGRADRHGLRHPRRGAVAAVNTTGHAARPVHGRSTLLVPVILFLILVALLFGAGAAIHALWWIAVIALALWL